MTLTEQQVREILAGCEGVTPGPWRGGHRCDGAIRAAAFEEAAAVAADPTRTGSPEMPLECVDNHAVTMFWEGCRRTRDKIEAALREMGKQKP